MSNAPITPEFRVKAPIIMQRLIEVSQHWNAPPVDEEDSASVVGNFGTETGGFTMRQEVGKPDKDSTGYGWAQWTGMDEGERRLLFEQWCEANGYDDVVRDPDGAPEERYDEACFGYFVHEISETWEKRVLTEGGTINGIFYPPLNQCARFEEKVVSFMKLFERPGTPHEDWRIEMAHEALRLYRGETEDALPYSSVVISSGHGKYVRGASGVLDEVDEARKVVDQVARALSARGVEVVVFHDDVSKSQGENLDRIVEAHNGEERDLDISVHFNAHQDTTKPMGTEVLYRTQADLASDLSTEIAGSAGFINRGPKKRTDLAFLNNTDAPAVLLEICFVDSTADAELYRANFDAVCEAIATVIGGPLVEVVTEEPGTEPAPAEAWDEYIISVPAGTPVTLVKSRRQ